MERLDRAQLGKWKRETLERAATRVETKRGPKNEDRLGERRLLNGEVVRLTMELGCLN